jgi:hypothetical protein
VETPSPLTLTQLSVESRVEPVDDFLYNTPRMTLQALKDATNVRVCPYYFGDHLIFSNHILSVLNHLFLFI